MPINITRTLADVHQKTERLACAGHRESRIILFEVGKSIPDSAVGEKMFQPRTGLSKRVFV